jgi:hypothetical protein
MWASRSSAWAAMAKRTVLAVVASRMRLVPLGQGDDAGAVGFGPGLLGEGEAFPGPVVEPGEHDVGLVDLVAGAAEVLADGAEVGAAADAVIQERGGLGPVGVGAGAGAHAQLHLQRRADHACFGEAGQALGEDVFLRAAGEPEGQSPGGEVVDGAGSAVSGYDAVVDEALVQGEVG